MPALSDYIQLAFSSPSKSTFMQEIDNVGEIVVNEIADLYTLKAGKVLLPTLTDMLNSLSENALKDTTKLGYWFIQSFSVGFDAQQILAQTAITTSPFPPVYSYTLGLITASMTPIITTAISTIYASAITPEAITLIGAFDSFLFEKYASPVKDW